MKKYLTLVFLSSLLTATSSAQAPKYVLFEHFTNTRCGVCGGTNPTFYQNISINTNSKLHHISMHSRIPYGSCVFYQANTTPQDARADYFNLPGTPRVFINGTTGMGAGSVTAATVDNAYCATCSPVEIKVSESDNGGGTRQALVKVKRVGALPTGNFRLLAAVVEKTVNYNAPNTETVHHNVFRQFLTPTEGVPYTLPAQNGGTLLTVFNYPLSTGVSSELYVVAWLFDETTKAVLNSGTRFDPTVVPVELTDFKGEIKESKNRLTWTTASEINTQYFDIERSTNSDKFETVGRVKAAGQSASPLTYAFEEENALQKNNYYRLKTVDLDGSFSISKTITLVGNNKHPQALKLFPSPATHTLNFSYDATVKSTDWRILDAFGKVVRQSLASKNGQNTGGVATETVDVSGLPNGVYLLQLKQQNGMEVARFVKN
jgi:hypothetical protein